MIFVWPLPLDLSGLGGPTRRRISRQHSSQGQPTTRFHSLRININKTEVMRVNNNWQEAIQLQGKEIKEADSFTYLGSVVSKDGGTDEDIKKRINKARHAFNTLRPIWRATSFSLQNKNRIFGTNVKSVLLYSSETWRVTKTNTNKLQTFINKCLRNVLQIK